MLWLTIRREKPGVALHLAWNLELRGTNGDLVLMARAGTMPALFIIKPLHVVTRLLDERVHLRRDLRIPYFAFPRVRIDLR